MASVHAHGHVCASAWLSVCAWVAQDLVASDGRQTEIAYLNGEELYRQNMDSGNIDADTLASSTVSGSAESTFDTYDIDISALSAGENVVSAEVHQAGVTSSDTTFDLILSIDTVAEK